MIGLAMTSLSMERGSQGSEERCGGGG